MLSAEYVVPHATAEDEDTNNTTSFRRILLDPSFEFDNSNPTENVTVAGHDSKMLGQYVVQRRDADSDESNPLIGRTDTIEDSRIWISFARSVVICTCGNTWCRVKSKEDGGRSNAVSERHKNKIHGT